MFSEVGDTIKASCQMMSEEESRGSKERKTRVLDNT